MQLYKKSVIGPGHIVSRKTVQMDREKVDAIKAWPRPEEVKELNYIKESQIFKIWQFFRQLNYSEFTIILSYSKYLGIILLAMTHVY